MTELWFILWWDLLKKVVAHTWPFLLALAPIAFGFWRWRKERRLALRPHIEPIYELVLQSLRYTNHSGTFSHQHWVRLDDMVFKRDIFLKKTLRRFLEQLLQQAWRFRDPSNPTEAMEWAKDQEKRAMRLFRKYLDV